ncbi:MAG: nickel pincer cofactor biosynthesis protein LarB [Deltaproteobacteria bacterium]|nr:nickel pincer cofactor biosynthesis protein LarB [Deltaproteobacteria bacterium]MBW2122218.1 nickel pincer cofactor biosynthesis protein LarB [Deltaproteobacteria bacterium]
MDEQKLRRLLEEVKEGERTVEEALHALKGFPFEDIGDAVVDHHRQLRRGFPEVIMGEGKSEDQISSIVRNMTERGANVLITRVGEEKARGLREVFPEMEYHRRSRTATLVRQRVEKRGKGKILILTAGTADVEVGEEAMITAEMMGNEVEMVCDVGVAGIHRLFHHRERIMGANVLIVVAGMEGALPSVVGGLVDRPVIAVPTSTGYGASFKGLAALLGMLNSCAAGVTVVNIDNGFGAGYTASLINRCQEER